MTSQSDDRKTQPGRRGRGFRRAGDTARKAVDRIAGKYGFAEADVLLNWTEIAGAALAAVCEPVKVSYGRERTLGATLIVRTTSARAPEIEMRGPAIVERVNQHYGYRAIRRLKVTQSTGLGKAPATGHGTAPGFAEAQAGFEGPSAAPSDDEIRIARQLAEEIRSPGLRDQISRMGANVMARARTKKTE